MTDALTLEAIGEESALSSSSGGGNNNNGTQLTWIFFIVTGVAFVTCWGLCLRSPWCFGPEDIEAERRRRTQVRLSTAMLIWTQTLMMGADGGDDDDDSEQNITLTREEILQVLIKRRVMAVSYDEKPSGKQKNATTNKTLDDDNNSNSSGVLLDVHSVSTVKSKKQTVAAAAAPTSPLSSRVAPTRSSIHGDRSFGSFLSSAFGGSQHNNNNNGNTNSQRASLALSEPLDYGYRRSQSAPVMMMSTPAVVTVTSRNSSGIEISEDEESALEEFRMDDASMTSQSASNSRGGVQGGGGTTADGAGAGTSNSRPFHRFKSNIWVRTLSRVVGGGDNSEGGDEASSTHNPLICDICLLEYEVGDHIAWSPNDACPHAFHTECITEWLLRNPTCPMCRNDYCKVTTTTTTGGGGSAGVGPTSVAAAGGGGGGGSEVPSVTSSIRTNEQHQDPASTLPMMVDPNTF